MKMKLFYINSTTVCGLAVFLLSVSQSTTLQANEINCFKQALAHLKQTENFGANQGSKLSKVSAIENKLRSLAKPEHRDLRLKILEGITNSTLSNDEKFQILKKVSSGLNTLDLEEALVANQILTKLTERIGSWPPRTPSAIPRTDAIDVLKHEPIRDMRLLGGGRNETWLVTFENGEKAVFKPMAGEKTLVSESVDKGPNSLKRISFSKEVNAHYLIEDWLQNASSRARGLSRIEVPPIVEAAITHKGKAYGVGSIQSYKEGFTTLTDFIKDHPEAWEVIRKSPEWIEAQKRAEAIGFISGNLDRFQNHANPVPYLRKHNYNNVLVPKGMKDPKDLKMMLIDNAVGQPGIPEFTLKYAPKIDELPQDLVDAIQVASPDKFREIARDRVTGKGLDDVESRLKRYQSTIKPSKKKRPADNQLNTYFLMQRLFKNGTFQDIIDELPNLEKMGVNTLWISPPHPQTMIDGGFSGLNNHGYWPSNHGAVDPVLGGEKDFIRLIEEGKKHNVSILVDAVVNHFGYADEFKIGKQTVSRTDPNFFKPPNPNGELMHPRELELYTLLDKEIDPAKLRAYQKELTRFPLWGLLSLEHKNPIVAQYLIDSYKHFVDLGINAFRIDAAKHIDLDFLHNFTEALTKHGRKKGRKIRFMSEMIFKDSGSLDVFAKDAIARATDKDALLFLDFPLANELRRLQDPNYRLDWFMGFLDYRQANRHPTRNYIPMLENHDFEGPLLHPFRTKLSYALSEFVSENPTIIHHGSEQTGRALTGRPLVHSLDPAGDKIKLRKELTEALAPYRADRNIDRMRSHVQEGDVLVLERTHEKSGGSIFLAANKSDQPVTRTFSIPSSSERNLKIFSQEGNAKIDFVKKGEMLEVTVTLQPQSFTTFELKSPKRTSRPEANTIPYLAQ